MGEHNSPYFAAGCADGARDAALVSAEPARDPVGMDPAKEWSWMYKRGYNRAFTMMNGAPNEHQMVSDEA